MNYKYFMDSNVLATSNVKAILETDFFLKHCIVIGEVAYELESTTFADKLSTYVALPKLSTLQYLKPITDDLVKLGILKTDHGNGEALLIAEAMAMKASENEQIVMDFIKSHPVIVTNEKAVDTYAKSKGLKSINGAEFMSIFNAAVTKQGL